MQTLRITVAMAAVLTLLSCHKSSTPASPVSLNIVNAIAGSQPLIPVLGTTDTIQYYAGALTVGYAGAQLYSPLSGPNLLYVVQNTDTLPTKATLFSGTLDLSPGAIYSFFLAGDTARADTLLVRDHIPLYNDSSTGARFVNLSKGSQAMTVTLDGNSASQTEFSGLGYKAISSFKTFSANSTVPGFYTFVIRDEATGDSLTSYTWYYSVSRNNTLVISGSVDPASSYPLQVFAVNNY